ncbi:MAG: phosphoribosylanthranilate isomerase [Pseudomonadota bacterium]
MSVLVKVCGLTRADHVTAAAAAGADALGFVFAKSPREVSPRHAAEIARNVPGGVLRVAVMRHPSQAEWDAVASVFAPDVLQTDVEDFASLEVADGVERWPVYREGGESTVSASSIYLYEGPKSGHGETVDWDRAAAVAHTGNMILAGGLSPANVADAVRRVRPFGVDASSGLESAPGEKSASKIEDFVAAAKRAAELEEAR